MNVFQKMFGTHSEREVKRIMPLVEKIEKLRPTMIELSDEELRGKTAEYKKRLAEGETLDDLLPEAYATVREAAQARTEYGTLPCAADRRYHSASGAYRRDENR